MSKRVADDHPILPLLFYVEGEIDDELRSAVEALVQRVAASRDWTLYPPEFVHEIDDEELEGQEGMSFETLGGVLQLYSTYPPLTLPREVDLAQLEEVEYLFSHLKAFSGEHQIFFDVAYDGESIGDIDNGELDANLSEGLIGEWRKALQE